MSLAAEVEKNLVESETDEPTYRIYQLKRLHDEQYEAFVATTGFGVGRMLGINEERLKLREERVPLDPKSANRPFALDGIKSEQRLPREEEIEPAPGSETPDRDELAFVADRARQDFLNPERFGVFKDGMVSGFVGHRIVCFPGLTGADDDKQSWQIARLELVSLLKFPQPAVYLSDELPNMERLANVPTRPLNEFEREALAKLRTEEDLVVRYSANTIRMLGSLRAGKTCLECHSVQRGELLGAFTYELRRTEPMPEPAPQPAKTKPEA